MHYAYNKAVKDWPSKAASAIERGTLIVAPRKADLVAGGNALTVTLALMEESKVLWDGTVLFDRFDSRLKEGKELPLSMASTLSQTLFRTGTVFSKKFLKTTEHALARVLKKDTEFVPAQWDSFKSTGIDEITQRPAREFDIYLGYDWMETWLYGPDVKVVSKVNAPHRLACKLDGDGAQPGIVHDRPVNAACAEHLCDSIRWVLRREQLTDLHREWEMAIWLSLVGESRTDFLLSNVRSRTGFCAWRGPIDATTLLPTGKVDAKIEGSDLIVKVPDMEWCQHAGGNGPVWGLACTWRYNSVADARTAWTNACAGIEFRLDRMPEIPLVGMGYSYRYGFKRELAAAHHLNLPEFESHWNEAFGGGPKKTTNPFDSWIECWWPERD